MLKKSGESDEEFIRRMLTDDEVTIKLINELKDLMLDIDPVYTMGRLVYIKPAGEYGFIIGPMAMGTEVPDLVKKLLSEDKNQDIDLSRVLLVTFSKEDYRPRVRYSKKKDIKFLDPLIEDLEFKETKTSLNSDLDIYCNKLCIFECSRDCIFWKYHKKRD